MLHACIDLHQFRMVVHQVQNFFPVKVYAAAQQESRLAEPGCFLFVHEQNMERRIAARAGMLEHGVEEIQSSLRIAAKDSPARRGSERYRGYPLRIVAKAMARIGVSPGPVEDVLAVGMLLFIKGHC